MTSDEVERLVRGEHHEPHRLLGAHTEDGKVVVRAFRPDATAVAAIVGDERVKLEQVHKGGLFEGTLAGDDAPPAYRLEVTYPSGTFTIDDPYRFWPTIGELDQHLLGEGRHERLWQKLGAHELTVDGVAGTAFAVWAPNARAVRVVGDWNSWDGRLNPMRALGSSGIWELFVPGVAAGARYKYELVTPSGALTLKADPVAFATEEPPKTAIVVYTSTYTWGDDDWMADQRDRNSVDAPISIYEVHLGSWRHGLSYRELADQLPDYVAELGFTHVEFMPVAEHPYAPSWGYQVSAYYAPTARFGTPDDLRYLIDKLHQRGIGVLVDWVPAHFPKDAFALARFDGTALYEHEDPRRGEHPDWGSLVFNFGRNEVRNFLTANALYWLEEFHVDGLRVDAVASMLYLDYSRNEGEWVPNEYGGNEDLDAVRFLKDFNTVTYREHPGAMTVAEESTAWPSVSRPVYLGGLGFGFKWSMGWMHDVLDYMSRDPVHRKYHHNRLTFGLLYAFSENFILPLSHDEVVHGKGSLLQKMPGDEWQRFANLRALYGFMYGHPGKKLLFMGGEFAQSREWSHDRSLDWHLLDAGPFHRGVQSLVRDLNHLYRDQPALHELDFDPAGFQWIDCSDWEQSIVAFLRRARVPSDCVVVACNFTPVVRQRYRVGVPRAGFYREVLNTDAASYGGGNVGNAGGVRSEPVPAQGHPHSIVLTLPPLGVLFLKN
ncbi:MAG TPA: 1,4-alpha-glucan branching protein GlgB [Actinomycetota bacterium]|nr:1,4-alpha-glucan branching protein GlgB [Actinomycetota bacterium]